MNMADNKGRELSLRETQLAALEILKQIDEICREEGLRYWLMYGSLIGAVRHNGFVPWDDDLDIGMPRDDYRHLITLLQERRDMFPNLAVLNCETVANCPILITRVSDTRYKMIGELGSDLEKLGVFVDVYPFDGVGDDAALAKALVAEDNATASQYVKAVNPQWANWTGGPAKRLYRKARSKLFLKSPSHYLMQLDDRVGMFAYDASEYVAIRTWPDPYDHDGFYPRLWFDGCVDAPFEGMLARIPDGYEEVLSQLYGNYMMLPPPEERIGHHNYTIMKRSLYVNPL